jgi:uncharacterized RDD family membrane protein YckC
VDYEDRMSIATPEGIELDLVLAGIGSRFAATLLDWLLKGVVLLGAFALGATSADAPGVAAAVAVAALFLVLFGYDVLFEVFGGGRTPGKRWTGLRVVTLEGDAIGAGASLVRNLLRIVDWVLLLGVVFVFVTRRNQRVGDLVAGTLVVRELRGELPAGEGPTVREVDDADLAGWDVSAVTADELATVRRFIERRSTLAVEARRRLALDLAQRLSTKVLAPNHVTSSEEFLELLLAVKVRRAQGERR